MRGGTLPNAGGSKPGLEDDLADRCEAIDRIQPLGEEDSSGNL